MQPLSVPTLLNFVKADFLSFSQISIENRQNRMRDINNTPVLLFLHKN